MNKLVNISIIIMMLCMSSTLYAYEEESALYPLPYDLSLSVVSESMIQNGMPVSIYSIGYMGQPKEIIEYYKSKWAGDIVDGVPPYVVNEISGWKIISKIVNGKNIVVQVRNKKPYGIEGYVSIADLDRTRVPDLNALAPKGSQVQSRSQSVDGPLRADTIILTNRNSVQSNRDFYMRELNKNGWQVLHEEIRQGAQVIVLSGNQGRLEVAIAPANGETMVVMNQSWGVYEDN